MTVRSAQRPSLPRTTHTAILACWLVLNLLPGLTPAQDSPTAAGTPPAAEVDRPPPAPPTAVGGVGIQQVAGGDGYSFAVDSDGRLWAWGANNRGQLGDGTRTDRLIPVVVLTGVKSVVAGQLHTLARKTDGSLWAWGVNSNGELGDKDKADHLTPVQVMPEVMTDVIAAAAGAHHSLALKKDGSLWAWGVNRSGELGDQDKADHLEPSPVTTEVEAVAGGAHHTLALKKDGSLWAWGANERGQVGTGESTEQQPEPILVMTEVKAVAAGGWHSLALKTDGSLWAWGDNEDGQLGNNEPTAYCPSPSPVQILPGEVVDVAAGSWHSLALKNDGSLWAWGLNQYCEIGDCEIGHATTINRSTPVPIRNNVKAVAAGTHQTLSIAIQGSLWAWGANESGQLGDGRRAAWRSPAEIVLPPFNPDQMHRLAAGESLSLVIDTDGVLRHWGRDGDDPSGVDQAKSAARRGQGKGSNLAIAVAYGWRHGLVIQTDNSLWAWGRNRYGQLGNSSSENAPSLVEVGGDLKGVAVAAVAAGAYHSLAITTDHRLFAWGANWDGQLGNDNTKKEQFEPVEILSLSEVKAAAAGSSHSLALTSDGSVWAWGWNKYGQLGDGSTDNRTTPTKVKDLTEVEAVAAGWGHSLALKKDGSLWAWGHNALGQLGNRTDQDSKTPVMVLPEVKYVVSGWYHTLAVKNDGALWAWGDNEHGQIGRGNEPRELEAIRVHLSNVEAVAAGMYHTLARTTDGSLWAWGRYRQPGDGTYTEHHEPFRVSGPADTAAGRTP